MTHDQQPYDEWLSEMERLEKEATPGQWKSDFDGDVFTTAEKEFCPGLDQNIFRNIGTTACGPDRGDAAFIAASRQFVPRAIQELWKRDRALEIAKEALNAYKFQSAKIGGVTHYSFAAEVLQQIEEVLNGNK